MVTLAERFQPRSNSLNALRLMLASAVVVSHSWPVTGRHPEPNFGGSSLGGWAVCGFFGISGYLITRSRLNGRPARDFYRARALRIMPAFLVALLLVAFVFAPLSQLVDPDADWQPSSSIGYVLRNLMLYPAPFSQPGVAGTLADVPYAGVWDGPLWTLWWEGLCYIAIGVAVSVLPRRALAPVAITAFVAFTGLALAGALGAPLDAQAAFVIPLFSSFLSGTLLLLFADRIRMDAATITVATGLFAVTVVLELALQVGPLLFAYLLLVLGVKLPLSKVGAKFDISYGVYIYAFPVQQFAVLMGGAEWPLFVYVLVVFGVTLPIAFLSSWLIERPALKLKSKSVPPTGAVSQAP